MSITDEAVRPDTGPAAPTPGAGRRPSNLGFWLSLGLVCLLLAGSGGVRWWQSRRLAGVLRDARDSPFPLESLPMKIGTWTGKPVTLDPLIVRVSGATDIITRRYTDQTTGASLEAIVLYGPSSEVFLHRPEVCYPNAGFTEAGDAKTVMIKVGKEELPFRSLVYAKGEGGQSALQEVIYSWRYNGKWSPDLVKHKEFERIPGMFKVHVARTLTPKERRDIDNPNEEFLRLLLPVIEARLARDVGQGASTPPPVAPSAKTAEGAAR
ncbi:exosortase-associated EpsI family protein [Singulisphaera sp. PoT]|uniref:exosortase-associated EpsI family protein n=1 Tax=Singulisphaera sp. PoT TaxID=3411797 RepID=UPI003BF55910